MFVFLVLLVALLASITQSAWLFLTLRHEKREHKLDTDALRACMQSRDLEQRLRFEAQQMTATVIAAYEAREERQAEVRRLSEGVQ